MFIYLQIYLKYKKIDFWLFFKTNKYLIFINKFKRDITYYILIDTYYFTVNSNILVNILFKTNF